MSLERENKNDFLSPIIRQSQISHGLSEYPPNIKPSLDLTAAIAFP